MYFDRVDVNLGLLAEILPDFEVAWDRCRWSRVYPSLSLGQLASTVACSQSPQASSAPSSVQLWHPLSFGIPPNPACRAPLDWTRQQSGTAERWGGIHLGHRPLSNPPAIYQRPPGIAGGTLVGTRGSRPPG